MNTYIAFYNTEKERENFNANPFNEVEIYVKNAEIKQGDLVYLYLYGKLKDGIVAKGIALTDSCGETNKKYIPFRIEQSIDEKSALRCSQLPIDRTKLYIKRKEGERKKDSAFNINNVAEELNQIWGNWLDGLDVKSPEEISNRQNVYEGAKKKVYVNAYERNKKAREMCLAHHGCKCSVCDILLEDKYGEIAKDFIHVHHLVPLSSVNETYKVDPIKDLIPVCPNCHSILHKRDRPYSVDELKEILNFGSSGK
ncbi:MAG: HNH endonuclease [Candidatus Hinthialibacter antarcticus]|nr:HNH endonuclease [Candidatus Hinthialibacter antarcticus]